MRSPLRFAAVLGLGLLAAPPAAAQDTAWPLYRNEKFGEEGRGRLPFEHAIALVEPARLGRANPSELLCR